MKFSGRSFAFAAAGAALAACLTTAPASADTAQFSNGVKVTIHTRGDGTKPPAHLGNPTEWGVAEIPMDDSTGGVRPMVIENVGGGQWSYGWYLTTGGKYCYSNYYHLTVEHGSTVKIANHSVKDIVPAGDTSNANRTAGAGYVCYAWYSKY
ncbi:lactococcin 972 family bacteriocin [Streptomyces sp. UH6]|uniref:lactococcin 972 family bacteriocin n=1 Tax=Streptomyces sp. UH6 TaxID=2748379 RepID=UPI00280B5AAF|nr:lactococcin 972 family bacteriocin [Streptomyces sp. UH6]